MSYWRTPCHRATRGPGVMAAVPAAPAPGPISPRARSSRDRSGAPRGCGGCGRTRGAVLLAPLTHVVATPTAPAWHPSGNGGNGIERREEHAAGHDQAHEGAGHAPRARTPARGIGTGRRRRCRAHGAYTTNRERRKMHCCQAFTRSLLGAWNIRLSPSPTCHRSPAWPYSCASTRPLAEASTMT